ncbi:hypothetical protein GCM10023187_55410 [Nibrella viscosa]|uniref:J domain-containing protein n=1 Tax=Nibrella viscosa TaxID=1084524 RepID=A0ABP8L155_9BACT
MKDYYSILGVSRTATDQEIKQAYRKLATKFHPDKNDGDPFWEERFKDIQEAYSTLNDQAKRRQFDARYTNGHTTNGQSSNTHNNTGRSSNENPYVGPPIIKDFKYSSRIAVIGEKITLTWEVLYADKVEISNLGVVALKGSKDIVITKPVMEKYISIRLLATNTRTKQTAEKTVQLENKLYTDFEAKFKADNKQADSKNGSANTSNASANTKQTSTPVRTSSQRDLLFVAGIILLAVFFGVISGINKPSESTQSYDTTSAYSVATPNSENTLNVARTQHTLLTGVGLDTLTKAAAGVCTSDGLVNVTNKSSKTVILHLTWVVSDGRGGYRWKKWQDEWIWTFEPNGMGYLSDNRNAPLKAGGYRYYITNKNGRPLAGSAKAPFYSSTCDRVEGIYISD